MAAGLLSGGGLEDESSLCTDGVGGYIVEQGHIDDIDGRRSSAGSARSSRYLYRSRSLPHLSSHHDSGVGGCSSGTYSGVDIDVHDDNRHEGKDDDATAALIIRSGGRFRVVNASGGGGGGGGAGKGAGKPGAGLHEDKASYAANKLVADIRQLLTLKQHYYPEGGWGWIILVVGVLVQILTHGLQISSAVLIKEVGKKFGTDLVDSAVHEFNRAKHCICVIGEVFVIVLLITILVNQSAADNTNSIESNNETFRELLEKIKKKFE